MKIRFRTSEGRLEILLRRTPQTPEGYRVSFSPQRAVVNATTRLDKQITLAEMQIFFDRDWQDAIIEFRGNRLVIKLNSLGIFEIFDSSFNRGVISISALGPIEIDRFELME